jgi:hypothetical protein
MFKFLAASACVAGASSAVADSAEVASMFEDEGLQLLQVAAKKHNHTHQDFSRGDGYCAFWGDTHTVAAYNGHPPDPQQFGLYTLANSKDGRFKSQLYQCAAWHTVNVGWINAMAYDIDGTRVVILPPIMSQISNNGPVYIRANDVEYSSAQLPFTIPGTSIEIRAHKPPYGFHIVTEGFDARVEMMTNRHPYCYVDTGLRLQPDNIPDTDENSFCVKGPAATPIADDAMDADWSDSLFSNADHERICDYCQAYNQRSGKANVRALKCAKPPPVPPPPPAKKECEDNGCSWTHAQQLCSSLQGDDVLYNDCLFDFCLECDDDAAIQFVAEDEDENPDPICVAGAPECAPEEVCNNVVKMNTLTVTQNNLGGVGPDEGAEEIRYGNAAVVNGKTVDLVLTTDGEFKSSKPSKNGNAGAFGVLNVKCGSSVSVTMKVVDAETGAPVTLDAVALTWYDLDEGKKAKGRATVTTCGSTGAIVSENTELTVVREGDCSSATSSVAGTGKDNPKSPHQLDSVQVSRSVTLPFKQVSEFSSTLSLAKGSKGRNFLFALEPSVACL